jgi:hypothetical protein
MTVQVETLFFPRGVATVTTLPFSFCDSLVYNEDDLRTFDKKISSHENAIGKFLFKAHENKDVVKPVLKLAKGTAYLAYGKALHLSSVLKEDVYVRCSDRNNGDMMMHFGRVYDILKVLYVFGGDATTAWLEEMTLQAICLSLTNKDRFRCWKRLASSILQLVDDVDTQFFCYELSDVRFGVTNSLQDFAMLVNRKKTEEEDEDDRWWIEADKRNGDIVDRSLHGYNIMGKCVCKVIKAIIQHDLEHEDFDSAFGEDGRVCFFDSAEDTVMMKKGDLVNKRAFSNLPGIVSITPELLSTPLAVGLKRAHIAIDDGVRRKLLLETPSNDEDEDE